MTDDLKRRVLITGGTGNLGESLIGGFASNGYDVTFVYRKSEARANVLAKQFGATAVQCDLSKNVEILDVEFDVLVNNAAINETTALTGNLPLENWIRTIEINLTVPFRIIQKCLPYMVDKNWGRIVNVSSIYGLRAVEGNLPYTVSKHGLSGLTKTVAREYGGSGITCNEICPGPIQSSLLDRKCAEWAAQIGISEAEALREVIDEIPTGKLVMPSEVTSLAIFLSSESTGAINGSSFVIDGGMIA